MKELFLFSNFIEASTSFAYIFHFFLVVLIILALAYFATKKLTLIPRGLQNIFEAFVSLVEGMGTETLGSRELARRYLPLVATIGLIVLVSNLIGVIPGFEAPSASLNLTLALALCVVFYYNFEGVRRQGFIAYFKHFLGPNKWLAPIMLPVEIISHLSRVVSLSFRLFGNIKGDDLFLMVVLSLAPFVAPLPAFALLSFMACLQTYIFMTLTYVYLAGAVVVQQEH